MWNFRHFQGKSAENFPPIAPISGTFLMAKKPKNISQQGF
ncbi:hypothetical protein C789_515 [Microcystis aeruginosa FACHB-905 = DIANCHI905]|uniref:Uncharacterized protein n=1 Tax=Microcystis aeruginosa PCC 7806SL TaxID=1903187 RepID=A0AB33BXU1_MICA7|nr:hypothetical protein BH695_1585 [Microcystis aeruginosa PCC 7806SL]ELS49678.1 hypothetical protein C789_515 [Microcystis aeruginosa FACHB-905 = DIANCHI905]